MKFMFTCVYILHRLHPLLGTKIGFSQARSSFLLAGSSFRPKHGPVAASSTVLPSATAKNEMGGYVTIPCSSKMTQRSSTADWFKL